MRSTIVCAVDLDDDASSEPLRVAAELAGRLDRPLVAAHVAPTHPPIAAGVSAEGAFGPPGPAPAYPYPMAPDAAELDEIRDDARRTVERLLEQRGVRGAQVDVAFDADVAEGLRRIARDRDAELLVVGSRGRGALRAALLGSTSHALATEAPCPVVVVPTHG